MILGYNSKPEEKQAFINTVKRPFQPFQLMWVSSASLPGSTLLLHCRCLSSLLCCHHRLHSFPSGRHGILWSRHSDLAHLASHFHPFLVLQVGPPWVTVPLGEWSVNTLKLGVPLYSLALLCPAPLCPQYFLPFLKHASRVAPPSWLAGLPSESIWNWLCLAQGSLVCSWRSPLQLTTSSTWAMPPRQFACKFATLHCMTRLHIAGGLRQ